MRSMLVCAAFAIVAGTAVADTVIVNGSFEENNNLNPGGAWTPLGGGNTAITGWTTLGGGVDYIGTLWPASDGIHSVDINNTSPGGVAQTFNTQAGQRYIVTFDMSANMGGAPALKTMDVSAAGQSASFEFDYIAEGATQFDPHWASHEWSFVATSSSTTLSFMSTSSGVYGPAIDNVVVVVPAPGSAALALFGFGLMIRRR